MSGSVYARVGVVSSAVSGIVWSSILLYSFEDFSLDTTRRELRRSGTLIALQPQVFDLLEYSIRNRERVVTKRSTGCRVERTDCLGIDFEHADQCGAQRDRRQRRGTAPPSHRA